MLWVACGAVRPSPATIRAQGMPKVGPQTHLAGERALGHLKGRRRGPNPLALEEERDGAYIDILLNTVVARLAEDSIIVWSSAHRTQVAPVGRSMRP